MNKIKVKGKLTSSVSALKRFIGDEATISLTPPTAEEISKLKEGDEVLVRCKVRDVKYSQGCIVAMAHHIDNIYAILPQDKDLKKLCEATQDGTLKEMFKEYCSCEMKDPNNSGECINCRLPINFKPLPPAKKIEEYKTLQECIYHQEFGGKRFCCHTWKNIHRVISGKLTIKKNKCIDCGKEENMILIDWN
jgi:hypothetical protein